jgi:hypothetical protein
MHDNARPEGRRRVFGYPDFIPTVEAAFPRFFEVGPHVLTAMHSVADRECAAPEPHQRAILNLRLAPTLLPSSPAERRFERAHQSLRQLTP